MTQQSGGAGIPVTQSVAGVLSGNILAPAFATNGTTPILGVVTNQLGANVSMVNANQFYDGPVLALTIGSWLLAGVVTLTNSVAGGLLTAKLWDGASSVLGSGVSDPGASGRGSIFVGGVVVLAAPATYRISAVCPNVNALIAAAAQVNGAGNNASYLSALRIA